MEFAKLFLSTGKTYRVKKSPEDVYSTITHSDGKSKNLIHQFTLENGEEVYINARYVMAIEKVGSEEGGRDEEPAEEAEDRNRVKANVEAAKEFKEDIDGNME